MKERERVANTFTSIATGWDQKGNIIASCIGQKNPFKTEYQSWIHDGMKVLDVALERICLESILNIVTANLLELI